MDNTALSPFQAIMRAMPTPTGLELEAMHRALNNEFMRAAAPPQERGTMKEATGNIWDCIGKVDAICITTNGFITKNGRAVMERGCAKEAANRWPDIEKDLGYQLKWNGNKPFILKREQNTAIVSFPVKEQHGRCRADKKNVVKHMQSKFEEFDVVPGWALKASLARIEDSANQLMRMIVNRRWQNVILPRPRCGAGELKWEQVKPTLGRYLDDRVTVMTF